MRPQRRRAVGNGHRHSPFGFGMFRVLRPGGCIAMLVCLGIVGSLNTILVANLFKGPARSFSGDDDFMEVPHPNVKRFSPEELSDLDKVVLFRREDRDVEDPSREAAWLRSRLHPKHDVILLASTNLKGLEMFNNMICSMFRSKISYLLDHMVVWALDEAVGDELVKLHGRIRDDDFLINGVTEEDAKGRKLFGVYYDPSAKEDAGQVAARHKNGTFLQMMELRGEFFTRLLGVIKVNFVLSDTDIYYLSDPLSALNLPWGIPDAELDRAQEQDAVAHQNAGHLVPATLLYTAIPDVVYSTDARKPYHILRDPYEGRPLMPEICGGFFFARANNRTTKIFDAIRKDRLNDQWDLLNMLNFRSSLKFLEPWTSFFTGFRIAGVNSVIVDPLPAGLRSRKKWYPLARGPTMRRATWRDKADSPYAKHFERGDWLVSSTEAEEILRVRLLSQAAFANALPEYAVPGTRGPGFETFVSELSDRGEREVMYHANWNANKTLVFSQLGMWKVSHDEGRQFKCLMDYSAPLIL